jgi:hypothetical protein
MADYNASVIGSGLTSSVGVLAGQKAASYLKSQPILKKMKGIITTILASVLCLYLFIPHSPATPDRKDEITVVIPAEVLARFANDVLPVEITKEKKFSGVIWIQSIDGLKLGINTISCSLRIRGEDITYTGKIGDLPASVSLGSIDAILNCKASMRYDEERQILYVKPTIMGDANRGEVLWPLLVALIGEREYPIELQKLKPLIARFGKNSITIGMDISRIYTADNRLFIGIRPRVKQGNE